MLDPKKEGLLCFATNDSQAIPQSHGHETKHVRCQRRVVARVRGAGGDHRCDQHIGKHLGHGGDQKRKRKHTHDKLGVSDKNIVAKLSRI
jgi:hypothetical protein